jgi:hypothetical protein
MRILAALVLGGVCAFASGCTLMGGARRTAPSENIVAAESPVGMDNLRAYKLAETAWSQWAEANSENAYALDYVVGFKTGFAEYLQNKSDGEPPTVPPPPYGPGPYETAQDRQAVQEWFKGFREGATQAHGSGLRPEPVAAARPASPPLAAPPLVRHVHEPSPSEILVLPVVMISTSGIGWGEQEDLPRASRHDPL